MPKLNVTNTITIHATAVKVWDALTNPEQTKKYMFGCEAISDWKPGSALLWKGIYEGKEMIFVKGIILEYQPNKILKFTVIDPHASYPDIPENHLNVTYELMEQNGQTTLTVIQDGFEKAAEGEKRYQDVYNDGKGWDPILTEIKKVAEAD
ncbi:MAG TPA: SRPBCC domain-containing protein [Chitinophagaceae bacterium]|nr:SRPBCC domain-containing protein [Chitinophagaceae bacterium]